MPDAFGFPELFAVFAPHTIILSSQLWQIFLFLMAPLPTSYNIIVVKYNIWYSFISKQFLLHEWYFLLIINIFGGIAGHTVCHWLVSQSSSKWTLPLAGVVVVVSCIFLFKFFRKLNNKRAADRWWLISKYWWNYLIYHGSTWGKKTFIMDWLIFETKIIF